MKPYGRKDKPLKSFHKYGGIWKKDYHLHDENHRKVGNWWEEMSEDYIDRGAIKQKVKKEIEKEIDDGTEIEGE